MIEEMLTDRVRVIEETYRKRTEQLEKEFQRKCEEIDAALKTKLSEQVKATEKQRPIVNVTVENRLRVTKNVMRDDRGLITQIIEETVPIDDRTSS